MRHQSDGVGILCRSSSIPFLDPLMRQTDHVRNIRKAKSLHAPCRAIFNSTGVTIGMITRIFCLFETLQPDHHNSHGNRCCWQEKHRRWNQLLLNAPVLVQSHKWAHWWSRLGFLNRIQANRIIILSNPNLPMDCEFWMLSNGPNGKILRDCNPFVKSINIRRWNFSDFDQRKYFAPGPAAVGRRVPLEWAIMQLRQRCSSHARTVFLPALSCLPACLATPNLFSGMSIRVKTKSSLIDMWRF